MSLQLEQDAQVPIQTHIDEFSSRFAIMIFIWIVTTIIWITNIDSILEKVIHVIDPCVGECTNLYNPAKWSEIRWLSGALLGFITLIPLFIYQVFTFSRPGMMKKEANWLLTWLVLGSVAFIVNIILTIFLFIPYLFEIGHNNHVNLGFVAKYDVVAMLTMAMAVIWIEVLVISGVFALVTAGTNGLMHEGNSRWWRLRVHGIISMLILLSFYGQFTLSISLMAISYTSIEIISIPWIRAKSNLHISSPTIFDEFGITRKILFAQCECDNDYNLPKDFTTSNAFISFKSICTSKNEKEKLYEIIETNKFTDFFIFGCNSNILNSQIENNLFISKCKLRLEMSSHNPKLFNDLEHYANNTNLLISSITDPWNIEQSVRKMLEIVRMNKGERYIIKINDGESIDHVKIDGNHSVLHIRQDSKNILITELESLGCKYTLVES